MGTTNTEEQNAVANDAVEAFSDGFRHGLISDVKYHYLSKAEVAAAFDDLAFIEIDAFWAGHEIGVEYRRMYGADIAPTLQAAE